METGINSRVTEFNVNVTSLSKKTAVTINNCS
jgi:hypothetical protein